MEYKGKFSRVVGGAVASTLLGSLFFGCGDDASKTPKPPVGKWIYVTEIVDDAHYEPINDRPTDGDVHLHGNYKQKTTEEKGSGCSKYTETVEKEVPVHIKISGLSHKEIDALVENLHNHENIFMLDPEISGVQIGNGRYAVEHNVNTGEPALLVEESWTVYRPSAIEFADPEKHPLEPLRGSPETGSTIYSDWEPRH